MRWQEQAPGSPGCGDVEGSQSGTRPVRRVATHSRARRPSGHKGGLTTSRCLSLPHTHTSLTSEAVGRVWSRDQLLSRLLPPHTQGPLPL